MGMRAISPAAVSEAEQPTVSSSRLCEVSSALIPYQESELAHKQYPACMCELETVIFPQFALGVGSGDTRDEAIDDAGVILALRLRHNFKEVVPPPMSMEQAQRFVSTSHFPLDDSEQRVVKEDWVLIRAKFAQLAADD
jgi:hypothetical protein